MEMPERLVSAATSVHNENAGWLAKSTVFTMSARGVFADGRCEVVLLAAGWGLCLGSNPQAFILIDTPTHLYLLI